MEDKKPVKLETKQQTLEGLISYVLQSMDEVLMEHGMTKKEVDEVFKEASERILRQIKLKNPKKTEKRLVN